MDSIRSRIQQLPPKAEVEPATLSMYQLVQRLYEDILALRALGYGAQFICQLLQDESGLPFRPSTLATYVSQEKRRRGGSRKRSRSGPGRSGSRGSAPGNLVAGRSGPGNSGASRSGPGNSSSGHSSPGGSASGRSSTAAPTSRSPLSDLEDSVVDEQQELLEADGSVSGDFVVDDDALRDTAAERGDDGEAIRDCELGDGGDPVADGALDGDPDGDRDFKPDRDSKPDRHHDSSQDESESDDSSSIPPASTDLTPGDEDEGEDDLEEEEDDDDGDEDGEDNDDEDEEDSSPSAADIFFERLARDAGRFNPPPKQFRRHRSSDSS